MRTRRQLSAAMACLTLLVAPAIFAADTIRLTTEDGADIQNFLAAD